MSPIDVLRSRTTRSKSWGGWYHVVRYRGLDVQARSRARRRARAHTRCAHHLRISAPELRRSCTRRPRPPERAAWRAWMGRAHRDPPRQHGRPGRPRTRGDRLAGAVIVQPAAGAISSPARALRRAARWREARAGPWRARRANPPARRPPEGARAPNACQVRGECCDEPVKKIKTGLREEARSGLSVGGSLRAYAAARS